MSQENVEPVRLAWEAFIAGGVEKTLGFWTEDCLFEDFPEMPDRRVRVGHEGVVEAVRNFTEPWDRLDFEPVEFIDVGQDLVIAVIALRGTGGGSGAPLNAVATWLYEMRDGKIARARAFT